MTDMDEQDLKSHFAELRGADATKAPAFSAALDSAHAAQRPARGGAEFRLRGVRLVLATAVLALIVAGVSYSRRDVVEVPEQSILEWRARSDALLAIARPDVFKMMPPLRSSVLDTVLP